MHPMTCFWTPTDSLRLSYILFLLYVQIAMKTRNVKIEIILIFTCELQIIFFFLQEEVQEYIHPMVL